VARKKQPKLSTSPVPLPEVKEKRKLCVIGCPRAGTKYTFKVWNKVGVKIGHEYTAEHGTVSHLFVVDDPLGYPPMPWSKPTGRVAHVGERRDGWEFEHVWHQIRTPLKCIGSMALVVSVRDWEWFRRHVELPGKKADKRLIALHMWVKWNRLAAENASWTYRIEDMDFLWAKMCFKLKIPREQIPDVSKTTHRSLRWGKPFVDREAIKKLPDPTWEDLRALDADMTDQAYAMAVKYRYEEEA